MNPHPIASAILITWRRNGQYARRLVVDLSPAQWTAQPIAGATLNHPAWIFSHLNVYAPLCIAMARGQSFADPIDHKFGQRSEVSTNPSDYPHGPALLADYESLHTQTEEALVVAPPEVFAAANPLERWRAIHPTIGDMLVTLMVKHESGHLGQLSAWRRALGMPRVPM
ncbi:MAG: DinB family protein [Planctomycetota bacterium]